MVSMLEEERGRRCRGRWTEEEEGGACVGLCVGVYVSGQDVARGGDGGEVPGGGLLGEAKHFFNTKALLICVCVCV
jgi:hypothetical protein